MKHIPKYVLFEDKLDDLTSGYGRIKDPRIEKKKKIDKKAIFGSMITGMGIWAIIESFRDNYDESSEWSWKQFAIRTVTGLGIGGLIGSGIGYLYSVIETPILDKALQDVGLSDITDLLNYDQLILG